MLMQACMSFQACETISVSIEFVLHNFTRVSNYILRVRSLHGDSVDLKFANNQLGHRKVS